MSDAISRCGLEGREISLIRHGTSIVDSVNIRVAPGRVLAILGPNGAGKTSVLRMLGGLTPPSSGHVMHTGNERASPTDLYDIPAAARSRQISIHVSEHTPSFHWTCIEVVLMGRAPHLGYRSMESRDDVHLAASALSVMDAEHLSHRSITSLSAGERQRVLIARTLCQDTPIVLLDEPTSHLDPAHALALVKTLRALASRGKAVVVVLHDPNLAARAADEIVFMKAGRVVSVGDPEASLQPRIIHEVYGVESQRISSSPPAIVWGGQDEDVLDAL